MQHPPLPPPHQQESNRWPAEQWQRGPGGEPPRLGFPPDDDLEAIAEAEARAQVEEARAKAAAAAAAAAAVKEEEDERARAAESDPTTLAVVREHPLKDAIIIRFPRTPHATTLQGRGGGWGFLLFFVFKEG